MIKDQKNIYFTRRNLGEAIQGDYIINAKDQNATFYTVGVDSTVHIPSADKLTFFEIGGYIELFATNGTIKVVTDADDYNFITPKGDILTLKDQTAKLTRIDSGTWFLDISSQGGGADYILPTASATVKGGIKVGKNLTINPDGTLDASASGQQGPKGDKGDTGDVGPAGPQGAKGDQGIKGDTGDQGLQGPKGDKGDTGPAGPQGIKGDQGIQGPKGDIGQQGPKGDKGDPGDIANLPIASQTVLGGVKIGTGLSIDINGILSVNNSYNLVTPNITMCPTIEYQKFYIYMDFVYPCDERLYPQCQVSIKNNTTQAEAIIDTTLKNAFWNTVTKTWQCSTELIDIKYGFYYTIKTRVGDGNDKWSNWSNTQTKYLIGKIPDPVICKTNNGDNGRLNILGLIGTTRPNRYSMFIDKGDGKGYTLAISSPVNSTDLAISTFQDFAPGSNVGIKLSCELYTNPPSDKADPKATNVNDVICAISTESKNKTVLKERKTSFAAALGQYREWNIYPEDFKDWDVIGLQASDLTCYLNLISSTTDVDKFIRIKKDVSSQQEVGFIDNDGTEYENYFLDNNKEVPLFFRTVGKGQELFTGLGGLVYKLIPEMPVVIGTGYDGESLKVLVRKTKIYTKTMEKINYTLDLVRTDSYASKIPIKSQSVVPFVDTTTGYEIITFTPNDFNSISSSKGLLRFKATTTLGQSPLNDSAIFQSFTSSLWRSPSITNIKSLKSDAQLKATITADSYCQDNAKAYFLNYDGAQGNTIDITTGAWDKGVGNRYFQLSVTNSLSIVKALSVPQPAYMPFDPPANNQYLFAYLSPDKDTNIITLSTESNFDIASESVAVYNSSTNDLLYNGSFDYQNIKIIVSEKIKEGDSVYAVVTVNGILPGVIPPIITNTIKVGSKEKVILPTVININTSKAGTITFDTTNMTKGCGIIISYAPVNVRDEPYGDPFSHNLDERYNDTPLTANNYIDSVSRGNYFISVCEENKNLWSDPVKITIK